MDTVKTFLNRDDNTQAAGKNETVTRFEKKRQKRFLSDTMLNLHKKLVFRQKLITGRGVCKVHNIAQTKANRVKELGIINSKSLSKVAEDLCMQRMPVM